MHQETVFQHCRVLERDGVALFFKRVSTPGHQSHAISEKGITSRFRRMPELAENNAARQRAGDESGVGAENIQINPVNPDTPIYARIP